MKNIRRKHLKVLLSLFIIFFLGAGVFCFSNTGQENEAQAQLTQDLTVKEPSDNALHETCQEYFDRRVSEGWEAIEYDWPRAVLLSPGGNIRRELDLRNDIETLRPNAAGDECNIPAETGCSACNDHYTCVDEVTPDTNSYVMTSNASYLRDLYNLPASSGAGSINKIEVYARCLTTSLFSIVGDALILMPDGTYKHIKDIRENDQVTSFDLEAEELITSKVIRKHHHLEKEYLILNNALKITSSHLVYSEGKFKPAGDIKIGDLLLNEKGQEVKVTSMEREESEVDVYDLQLDFPYNFFAGGYLVHNNTESIIKITIKSDSTTTESAEKSLSDYDIWETISQEWTTNPADSQAWEWADIDVLQIGVALKKSSTGETYCTQIYVEVDYTPPYPLGHSCSSDSDCDSGNCTSKGMCCQEGYDGTCWASSDPTEDGHINNWGDRYSAYAWLVAGYDGEDVLRAYIEWNISSIPNGATITNTVFKYHGSENILDCHIREMLGARPTTSSNADVWNEIVEGTVYAAPDGFPEVGTNKQVDLGSSADTDLQSQLSSGWFAIGIQSDDENLDSASIYSEDYASADPKPTLYVEYTPPPPEVSTLPASGVGATSAIFNGNITDTGGATVTVRGFEYGISTSSVATTSESGSFSTGAFSLIATDLVPEQLYYFRAFATNENGTGYGDWEQASASRGCNPPTSGDFTITQSCTFPGFVNGVEEANGQDGEGDIIIEEGATLTINCGKDIGQTIVWNPGSKVIIGGSLAICKGAGMTGGQLRKSHLWMIDTDDDTYSASTSQYASLTAPTGDHKRRYTMATTTNVDCNDSSGYVYRLVAGLAADADKDGYISGATGTQCVGQESLSCGAVTFTYRGSQVTYGTVSSQGECWMDRNLGASQVATAYNDSAAYGDLFQWGRLDDNHQDRSSSETTTLSSADNPGHSSFIYDMGAPYDWRSPQNYNLWQGVSGTNNPCPSGWRIATQAEWEAERLSWSSNNYNGAFASPLKLTASGCRSYGTGNIEGTGSYGRYWTSYMAASYASRLNFNNTSATFASSPNAYGHSVRCIEDEASPTISHYRGTDGNYSWLDGDDSLGSDTNDSNDCIDTTTRLCCDDTNVTDGLQPAKSAGEQGLPVCKTCNGSSIDAVNIDDNTQDDQGSNTCTSTCMKCSGGSCINQLSTEDLFEQCATDTVKIVLNERTGSTCSTLCAAQGEGQTGLCDGSGACALSAYYCVDAGTDTAGTNNTCARWTGYPSCSVSGGYNCSWGCSNESVQVTCNSQTHYAMWMNCRCIND